MGEDLNALDEGGVERGWETREVVGENKFSELEKDCTSCRTVTQLVLLVFSSPGSASAHPGLRR